MKIKERSYSILLNTYKFLQQRFYCPSHLKILAGDILRYPSLGFRDPYKYSTWDKNLNSKNLSAAMDWLCAAQDASNDGGAATSYTLRSGWQGPYPEVTGYIIPTFFDYSSFTHKDTYRQRALKMADWLASLQMPGGAFQALSVDIPAEPRVFNTGQIILGMIRTYEETREPKYLQAAVNAGHWLAGIQDHNGAWKKYSYNSIPHTYHTRVAWPLAKLFTLTDEQDFKSAAEKNLQWALGNQDDDGWYRQNSFSPSMNPYMHNIIYAARGFLESGALLNQPAFIDSAQKAGHKLFRIFEITKFLPGEFSQGWKKKSKYSCLTGTAQCSILLMRLFEINGDPRYLNTALKLNQYLRTTQILKTGNKGIKGGIKGSDPIWQAYSRYRYPSWAAKFFADSLMLEDKILNKLDGQEH